MTDPVARDRPDFEDEVMRRLSSDNPRSRRHDERAADTRSAWGCIPISDVVDARAALLAAGVLPPDVLAKVRAADEAASIAHDYIAASTYVGRGPTRKDAGAAIWHIHDALRPFLAAAGISPYDEHD